MRAFIIEVEPSTDEISDCTPDDAWWLGRTWEAFSTLTKAKRDVEKEIRQQIKEALGMSTLQGDWRGTLQNWKPKWTHEEVPFGKKMIKTQELFNPVDESVFIVRPIKVK